MGMPPIFAATTPFTFMTILDISPTDSRCLDVYKTNFICDFSLTAIPGRTIPWRRAGGGSARSNANRPARRPGPGCGLSMEAIHIHRFDLPRLGIPRGARPRGGDPGVPPFPLPGPALRLPGPGPCRGGGPDEGCEDRPLALRRLQSLPVGVEVQAGRLLPEVGQDPPATGSGDGPVDSLFQVRPCLFPVRDPGGREDRPDLPQRTALRGLAAIGPVPGDAGIGRQ